MCKKVWITLLEVRPFSKSKNYNWIGAYVNGLTSSKTEKEGLQNFRETLEKIELELISYESFEEYRERIKKATVIEELQKLASHVEKTGETLFGCFHSWTEECPFPN